MAGDRAALEALLAQRLIVCVGPGGVGKTTTAAALGMAAALRGRATAVITADPSRRLKDALGLADLRSDPHPVDLGNGAGRFEALAIDTKRTFDRLIERVAANPAAAQRILANRLYRELSGELGGSAEYMAMEKLYELLAQGRYELIIVDTPPSADARALLAAPLRMTELLASQAVQFLKAPSSIITGSESSVMRLTLSTVLKALERWTGMTLLDELADFVGGFEHLIDGFRARAQAIDAALHTAQASFVLVTSAEVNTIEATLTFAAELREVGFPVAGTIANRVYDFPATARDTTRTAPALRKKLLANYADFAALSARDRSALARLDGSPAAPLLAVLPVLAEAPASLAGLRHVAELLAGTANAVALRRSRRGPSA